MLCYVMLCLSYEKNVFSVFFRNDSANSKRGNPPRGICRAFVMLPGLGGGELSENLCPGVGHLSILLDAVNVVLFSIFHLKKMFI